MTAKIAVLHTTMVTYESLKIKLQDKLPKIEIMNIVDDSLLADVRANEGLNEEIISRICNYGILAEKAGVSLILNACSSVGEAIDVLQKLVAVPCVKIDQAMVEQAVEQGSRIAVFGTVMTTLAPSARLIQKTASKKEKAIVVDSFLCQEAFEALTVEKSQQKHNMLLKKIIRGKEPDYDILVLAQASMAVLIPELSEIAKPILASPDSGVQRVKDILEAMNVYEK